jgi:hypothetical protein
MPEKGKIPMTKNRPFKLVAFALLVLGSFTAGAARDVRADEECIHGCRAFEWAAYRGGLGDPICTGNSQICYWTHYECMDAGGEPEAGGGWGGGNACWFY